MSAGQVCSMPCQPAVALATVSSSARVPSWAGAAAVRARLEADACDRGGALEAVLEISVLDVEWQALLTFEGPQPHEPDPLRDVVVAHRAGGAAS